jgi:branched-chain amino acid transport system permease protein
VALGSWLAVTVAFGKAVFPHAWGTLPEPNGLYLDAVVDGLLVALVAVGLVLIYRTTRIINFAQAALGAFGATAAAGLVVVAHFPYPAALVGGCAAGVAVSLLCEWAFIRRFARAPRLLLAAGTIALAQVLGALEIFPLLSTKGRAPRDFFARFRFPSRFVLTFGAVRFNADHLLALAAAPAILAALAYFLKRTRYGVAARAVAENEERAQLVGCPIKRVSFVVWGVAGLLSALAAILRTPIIGFQLTIIQGPDLLVRALAAAVIGGMESLWVTACAAVLITMGEQLVFFAFGTTGLADGFVFGVVLLGLFMQRRRFGLLASVLSSWKFVQHVRPVPRELARLREVVRVRRAGWAVLVGGMLVLPLFLREAKTSLVEALLVYVMVGASLVVLTGWSGNISLGQWAIVGLGALVAQKMAVAPSPPDFFVVLAAAGLCGAAASVLLGLASLRVRGLLSSVTTLAFATTAAAWILQWKVFHTNRTIVRPQLFGVASLYSERAFYYVVLAAAAGVLVVCRNLRGSRFGRNLIATRDNEQQAQALGIRLSTSRLTAFAIAGFIAAFAGAIYAYSRQSMDYYTFPATTSLVVFLMAVLGGIGSLTGAVLGAVFIRGTQFFLPYQLQALTTGFGLVLVLALFPGGLGQLAFALRDGFLRAVARRRQVVSPSLVADRLVLAEPRAPEARQPFAAGRASRR